jgi:hypothetical protein
MTVHKEQTYGGLAERHEVGPSKDETGENILDRLCDLENNPDEILAPYSKFHNYCTSIR